MKRVLFLRVIPMRSKAQAVLIGYNGSAEIHFYWEASTICEATHAAAGHVVANYEKRLLPLPELIIEESTISRAVYDILVRKGFKVTVDRVGLCAALDRYFEAYNGFRGGLTEPVPLFGPDIVAEGVRER